MLHSQSQLVWHLPVGIWPELAPGSARHDMEVSHVGWLRLQQVGDECFLEHKGTGEIHRLPGSWELHFHEGKGYVGLRQGGPADQTQTQWANTLLDTSLHCVQREGADKHFIKFKKLGITRWVADIHTDHSPLICTLQSERGAALQGFAAWSYACAQTMDGGLIFWELPYIQNALYGGCGQAKWITKRMPRWRSLMQHLGMGQGHIIKNHKSARAMARSSGSPIADAAYHSAGQEHLISTQGMLAVLAASARPHRKVAKDMRPKVLAILGGLILKFLGAFTFVFGLGAATDDGPDSGSGNRKQITITKGKFDLQQFLACRLVHKGFHKSLLEMCTAEQRADKQVPLAALVVQLGLAAMCPLAPEGTKAAFLSIVVAMADIIEIQRHGPVWTHGAPVGLPVLAGRQKLRRVSLLIKRWMLKKVAADPDLSNPKQAVAGMRLCTAAPPSGDASSFGLKGATTRSWNWDEMFQYLASMRKQFAKARSLSVALDATRLGGHDVLYAAVYSSDLMLGAWLPAQVAS